jgi:hypothetical protein
MPREVDLRIEALVAQLAPGTGRGELADRLGISDATLRVYLENRWTVLDRTVLERLVDFLQCDATALLTTTESRFFDTFRNHSRQEAFPGRPTCLYLRRADANVQDSGRALAYRDHRAIEQVATLLRESVDDRMVETHDTATTQEEFARHLRQNCVVVGSPLVNPAAEMALCHAFGVKPFDPASMTKVPFAFRIPEPPTIPDSTIVEASSDMKRGIWVREKNELIQADYWPPEEFRRLRINRGRDCAVVVVMNHQPGGESGAYRKLIILAGFGGAGTEMAAAAFADQYRALEPRDGDGLAWGVIEIFYKKGANSTTRKDLTYNWRYRVGGRCPVDFVSRGS